MFNTLDNANLKFWSCKYKNPSNGLWNYSSWNQSSQLTSFELVYNWYNYVDNAMLSFVCEIHAY